MPQYSFDRQRDIVVATMTVHNFICRHSSNADPDFIACDVDDNLVYPEANEIRTDRRGTIDMRQSRSVGAGTTEMYALRDAIADLIHSANR
ncbi:hypothetical protein KSP40_PGU003985 [Platanthera guangdongensis]|uniref:Uncharacterized protein n=1 Tax=Platanthera guangdongensis TaxID=2320717 RepID=A0ABR2LR33_9ASPA